jgi:dihydroorotase
VDVIGSDHAPHTLAEKNKDYPNSPSGMTGVQTLLPILLNFVNDQKLKLEDVVRLTSVNPCKIYKIKNKGQIKTGYDADLTIIDLNKEFEITNNWIASKSSWTPYDQLKVKGMPIFTIINGKVVMRENEIDESSAGEKVEFSFQ